MTKVELKAIKTFYNNGKFTVAGDVIKVDEYSANAYVSRGLAEKVNGAPVTRTAATAAPESTPDPTAGKYEEMTVPQLKRIAKEKGVGGYSQMTKNDLTMVLAAIDNKEQ